MKNKNKEMARQYSEDLEPIVGTIIEESHNSNGVYSIKVKSDDNKIYAVTVLGKTSEPAYYRNDITAESLDLLIENGSRVSFPKGNSYVFEKGESGIFPRDPNIYKNGESCFYFDTRAGSKFANRITILDNKAESK